MARWTAGRRALAENISSGCEAINNSHQTLAASRVLLHARNAVSRTYPAVILRTPDPSDGPSITELIRRCPPLDVNSAYCNLVQCAHFAETCVIAETKGYPVGWLSAHRPPTAPEQIFVWQVAVDVSMRGAGLGGRMLDALLARPEVRDAKVLTTTITELNAPSWALFEGFARRRGLQFSKAPFFTREVHFGGAHDTEWQASIGPLSLDQ